MATRGSKRTGDRRRGPTGRGKLFWTGRSQALRLPREFRLEATEVLIRREGRCLVIEPVEIERDAHGWPKAFWELAGSAPELDLGDRSASQGRGDVLRRR